MAVARAPEQYQQLALVWTSLKKQTAMASSYGSHFSPCSQIRSEQPYGFLLTRLAMPAA